MIRVLIIMAPQMRIHLFHSYKNLGFFFLIIFSFFFSFILHLIFLTLFYLNYKKTKTEIYLTSSDIFGFFEKRLIIFCFKLQKE